MAQLKYWDASLGQYVVLPGQGGQAVAYAPVQATPPNAAAPSLSPPMGFLWIDTSTTAPGNLPYYPPQTPPASGLNSYTDASGEIWLSRTGSAWRRARDVATARMYLSGSNQNVAPGNVTILLNSTSGAYDPLSSFSNNGYNVPVAGRYLVSGTIGLTPAPTTIGQIQAILAVNGGMAALGNVSYFPANAAAWPAATVHDIMYLHAGDGVTLVNFLSSGAANVNVMADPTRTYLAVHFLDPATP